LDNGYELHLKILECDGMKFLDRMKLHSFSHNIFSMNYHEIQEGLKLVENPEIGSKFFIEELRGAGVQAFREINRLFHNFLASAKTLIEHTRIFMNKYYSKSSVLQAYEQKVKNECANDELCKFIQDLRNYMLHQGLPHTEMELSMKRDGPLESAINLDSVKLREWSNWSSKSKAYLSKAPNKISMSSLVDEYEEKIGGLHSWLDRELRIYHKSDIKELEVMNKEYHAKYGAA